MHTAPAADTPDIDVDQPLGERALSKLRWRCRRGLLENDLFIARFFDRYAESLTVRQADAMDALMDLSDHDLMDLLLKRKEPDPAIGGTDVVQLLHLMRV
ncbi:MAG: succinate dehydrogenase assembly factor 2 [Janthinobacterium lividum]